MPSEFLESSKEMLSWSMGSWKREVKEAANMDVSKPSVFSSLHSGDDYVLSV